MRRLVIISNRVADPCCNAAGGLHVCILDGLRERGGLWFGWNGEVVESEAEITVTSKQHERVTFATMPLTERDYQEYYLGYCNGALWPVHHYRLDLARFTQENSESYRRVNRRFAEALAPRLDVEDLIWVHDYHFVPLAAELRSLGVKSRIGFFLHIPFPSPDVIVAMPEHEWLIESLLSYELLGFQTTTDQANFCRIVCETMGGEMLSAELLRTPVNTVSARVFPAGIGVESFAAMASHPDAAKRIEWLHRRGEPRTHIIGVDRLDYTKGLPDRFRSFKRLLELYPQNRKAATLMQIAPPTREEVKAYADIRHELEALSGEINGQFGDFDWTPVRYVHRNVPRETLAALYRGSQIGLVTPLRDGMNLVAKEYVAAQDPQNPGVLVLSRFAGAAEDLQEALIVNPYDTDEVAQAMQRAIHMPKEERIERHAALLERVRARSACAWMKGFLAALDNSSSYPRTPDLVSYTRPKPAAAGLAASATPPAVGAARNKARSGAPLPRSTAGGGVVSRIAPIA
ncbi:MAG TPA: trehalose-6-phosphate synthase [Methylocystis sp.]|nr:trehalose-6-phosphate synthase [Methylocystis sp.]